MATKFRVSAYFSGFNSGWTESMVFDRPETSPGAFASLMTGPLQKRAKALGRGYQIDAWSVRLIQNAAGQPVTGTGFLKTDGGLPFEPSQLAANNGDPTFVSGRFLFTNGAGTESRQGFLGGLPDAVTVEGGTLDLSKLNYAGNVGDYLNDCLQLGAGWMSPAEIGKSTVNTYSLDGSFIDTITLADALFTGFSAGQVLKARFARVNVRSVLNGAHNIIVVSPTTCRLKTPLAGGPFVASGQIRVYAAVPTFIQAAGAQIVARAAKHNRGRPFVARVGRQKARPTY